MNLDVEWIRSASLNFGGTAQSRRRGTIRSLFCHLLSRLTCWLGLGALQLLSCSCGNPSFEGTENTIFYNWQLSSCISSILPLKGIYLVYLQIMKRASSKIVVLWGVRTAHVGPQMFPAATAAPSHRVWGEVVRSFTAGRPFVPHHWTG